MMLELVTKETGGIEHLLTAKQVAAILGVSTKWLYQSRLRRKAIRIHQNRNGLAWRPRDIEEFIQQCQEEGWLPT